ncbi:ribosomal protein S18-alanine N-acetyltransferase [Limosilactobacillus fastidiosus]|nr:ribosomal protein S18-alanine N-acetyltransferase [Limosilactobacillus fastidiosus]
MKLGKTMFAKFKAWLEHKRGEEQLKFTQQPLLINGRQFTIRQARFTDISAIVHVEELIYGTAPWSASTFQIELERDYDRLYLVITYDGQVVGYVGCSFNWYKHESHITNIGVSPAYQDRGIGSKMITLSKDYAGHHGYPKMTLEVRIHNLKARKLYERLGFYQTSIRPHYYIDNREDAVEMEVKL